MRSDERTPSSKTRARSLDELQVKMKYMVTPEGIGKGLAFKPKPTDVFITPFGKCGTTWLQQIVHSLRTRGDLDFDDISAVVPWIETAADLGIDLDAPQRAQPRAFKSHLSWGAIPKGGKYIVAIRDPRDALVSMYRFMEGWFMEPGAIPIETFARQRYMQRGHGTDYWAHLVSWWQQRNNPSVLMLAYEHMKADLSGTIDRIAAFIGITLDAELRRIVMEQASLQSMLTHKSKYDDLLMRERSEKVCDLPPGSDSAKVRKGEVGAHAAELPAVIIAELDDIWRTDAAPHVGADSYAALIKRL